MSKDTEKDKGGTAKAATSKKEVKVRVTKMIQGHRGMTRYEGAESLMTAEELKTYSGSVITI